VGKYPVMEDYVCYYLARSLMGERKFDEAINHWETLLKNHPRSRLAAEARVGLGDCFFESGKFKQANTHYRRVSKQKNNKDPEENARRLFYSALCFEWDGEFKDAEKTYYIIWSSYPKTQTAAEVDIRLKILQKKKKIAAPSDRAYFGRIKSLMKLQEFSDAVTDIKTFLKNFPQSPLYSEVYAYLGTCYRSLRDYPEAIKTYREMVRRFKNIDVAAEGYYYLASIYWNRNMQQNPRPNLWVTASRYPDSEWADKALFMLGRVEENKKFYKKAINAYYKLYRKYPDSDQAAESLWRIGWIYYQWRKYDSGAKYLLNAAKVSKGLSLKNSSLYWRGRCLEKSKNAESAISSYRSVLKNNYRGYYAHLARKRLDILSASPEESPIPDSAPSPPPDDLFALPSCNPSKEQPERLEKVRELNAMELFPEAAEELVQLNKKRCRKRDFWIGLSRLYRLNRDYRRSIRALYMVYHDDLPRTLWQLLYPKNFEETIVEQARLYDLDIYLVMALIRQESVFDPQSLSSANAYGLMQIIPPTARRIAKKLKLEIFDEEMLYEPEVNIPLGVRYMDDLYREFKGNLTLMLAAYNAGEKAARRWKKRNDDSDPYRFIENISYPETRRYVKQVLKNYENYLWLYEGKNNNF
jgi:soluble lytic murein transglycosylase